MPEQKIFSTAVLGGFNKDEVLKYIDGMQQAHEKDSRSAEREIVFADEKLKAKDDELEESRRGYEELSSAYEELRNHFLIMKETLENTEEELESARTREAEREKELAIQQELNRQLTEKLVAFETESKKLEVMSAQWSANLDEVGESTKSMLSGARAGAQTILKGAEESLSGVNGEIERFCAELEKTKAFMQDSMNVLAQRLEYIDNAAKKVKLPAGECSKHYEEIERRCDKLATEVDEKLTRSRETFFQ